MSRRSRREQHGNQHARRLVLEERDSKLGGCGARRCGREVLRRGSRYEVAGAIAGPLVTVDLRTLYLKDLRLLGCTIAEPEIFAAQLRYIERAEIGPVLARTYQAPGYRRSAARFSGETPFGQDCLDALK
jgi:hypothetical protein